MWSRRAVLRLPVNAKLAATALRAQPPSSAVSSKVVNIPLQVILKLFILARIIDLLFRSLLERKLHIVNSKCYAANVRVFLFTIFDLRI
jgi:hypothetical protein